MAAKEAVFLIFLVQQC